MIKSLFILCVFECCFFRFDVIFKHRYFFRRAQQATQVSLTLAISICYSAHIRKRTGSLGLLNLVSLCETPNEYLPPWLGLSGCAEDLSAPSRLRLRARAEDVYVNC